MAEPYVCSDLLFAVLFFAMGGPLALFSVRRVPDHAYVASIATPFNPPQSPFNPQFQPFPAIHFTSSPISCYRSSCLP